MLLTVKILGKPHNRLEHLTCLILSGKSHEVITAFSFINLTEKILYSDCEVTKVYFKTLTDDEINWYIDTNNGWIR